MNQSNPVLAVIGRMAAFIREIGSSCVLSSCLRSSNAGRDIGKLEETHQVLRNLDEAPPFEKASDLHTQGL